MTSLAKGVNPSQAINRPGVLGASLVALGLGLVAMDGVGLDVILAQLVRKAVGADARAAEHQHLLQFARLDQIGKDLALFFARHRMDDVGH